MQQFTVNILVWWINSISLKSHTNDFQFFEGGNSKYLSMNFPFIILFIKRNRDHQLLIEPVIALDTSSSKYTPICMLLALSINPEILWHADWATLFICQWEWVGITNDIYLAAMTLSNFSLFFLFTILTFLCSNPNRKCNSINYSHHVVVSKNHNNNNLA